MPCDLPFQHQVQQVLNDHRHQVRTLLDQLVAINSFSYDKAGVDAVGRQLIAALPAGFEHECHPQDRFGDHHVLRRMRPGKPAIILAGHLDTLCPPNRHFDRVYDHGDRLLGPGVMDMKGGDVVLVWSLRVLESCGLLDDFSIICIFNSDEELGSPTSHGLFTAMKGQAQAALVFEASSPEGSIVTTRRGVSRHRLYLRGVESHFGCLKGRKVSALEEAAHKTLAIESLNQQAGVAANVGRIDGGLAANKVAHAATLDYELRCWEPHLLEQVRQQASDMVTRPVIPGVELQLEQLSYRPPMQPTEQTQRLFQIGKAVGEQLGLRIDEEKRGGVSDACWLHHAGIPTIDGLGPRGDHDFTPDEYLVTESLFERIVLTTHIMLKIREQWQ